MSNNYCALLFVRNSGLGRRSCSQQNNLQNNPSSDCTRNMLNTKLTKL